MQDDKQITGYKNFAFEMIRVIEFAEYPFARNSSKSRRNIEARICIFRLLEIVCFGFVENRR